MNKLLPILALLFFSCAEDGESNPVSAYDSYDFIELSWAVELNSMGPVCYFIESTDPCGFYYSIPTLQFQKYENIRYVEVDMDNNTNYVIEVCNNTYPDVVEGINSSYLCESNLFYYWDTYSNTCYEHYPVGYNSGCNLVEDIDAIQYK